MYDLPAARASVVMMTPVMAERLLGANVKNRPINRKRVEDLVRTIQDGDWLEDGNPVRISDKGLMLDAQHRLEAVRIAGIPVPMVVVENLPEASRLSIDTGLKRSFAHYLELNEVKQSAVVAATTTLLYRVEGGGLDRGRQLSNLVLWQFYKANESLLRDAVLASRRAVDVTTGLQHSVAATAYALFARLDEEDADDFFNKLALDTPMTDGDEAILTLIRSLRNMDSARGVQAGASQLTRIAITVKAWNAYRAGDGSPKLLVWRRGGKAKESFPVAK